MKKDLIIEKLKKNHLQFIDLILSLDEHDFNLSINNKWTAALHFQHIYLSVAPLAKALHLPLFFLKFIFGKANRQSREYEAVVDKYHQKLEKGAVATGSYIPKPIAFQQRHALELKLKKTVDRLCKKTGKLTEEQMDIFILPHPLLGKLTIREMLYFTIYHVEHHRQLLLRQVSLKDKTI